MDESILYSDRMRRYNRASHVMGYGFDSEFEVVDEDRQSLKHDTLSYKMRLFSMDIQWAIDSNNIVRGRQLLGTMGAFIGKAMFDGRYGRETLKKYHFEYLILKEKLDLLEEEFRL